MVIINQCIEIRKIVKITVIGVIQPFFSPIMTLRKHRATILYSEVKKDVEHARSWMKMMGSKVLPFLK
jgi:hypothetical protein